MKLYLFKVFSITLYFLVRLYVLTNKLFILSYNNDKLNEYIKNDNLENTTSNFDKAKNKNIFSIFLNKLDSPKKYKQVYLILLITFLIIVLNFSLNYNIIFSNFVYINILNKNLDIVSLFSTMYKFVRNIFFIIYNICIVDIVYNIFNSTTTYKLYLKLYKNKIIKIQQIKDQEIIKKEIVLGKKENSIIYLDKRGLYQNILITGSIGSGKTSSAISNILDGMIKNNFYGLIIDVKGNYMNIVEMISKKYNRENEVITFNLENDVLYNPLNLDINENEISHMLKKVLMLLSQNNNSDSFWLDKVENYLRDFICLIKSYNDYINFYEIHKLVTDDKYLKNKLCKVKEKILQNKFNDEELFKLRSSINNIKNEYINLDERTKSIINAEITRLTSIFVSNYSLYKKFCSKSEEFDFFNKIIVLSINIGKNKSLSKVISTYIKLDFQRKVLSRKLDQDSKFKTVFFICDEFQEICNKEDADFFSVSREYKCINVVSMQSYTSLVNSLNNENAAKVIIQNLVNKIWFRNDDNFTINEIINQIGKEIKYYKAKNISENGQNTRYNFLSNNFVDYKSGISKGYTYNQIFENKLSAEYFSTELKAFEAVCLLSNGQSVEYVDKIKFKRWEC